MNLKILGKWMICIGVLVFLDQLPAIAQDENKTKVTVTKETIDANGNKTTETIVIEGDQAEAIDLEKLAEGDYSTRAPQLWMRGFDQEGPSFFRGGDSLDLSDWFSFDFEPFKFFQDEDFGDMPFFNPQGRVKSGPRLGVQIQSMETQKGVLVNEVIEGSAAAEAGIQIGDVILSANEQTINEPSDLVEIINNLDLPADLLISVLRDDQYLDISVKFKSIEVKKEIQIKKI
ncbi:MAG: PDZ domain-containing protein [Saprospiraceae bacterium]|nr:PDZ domain-containing protein [Saprospiraceae bacterium]